MKKTTAGQLSKSIQIARSENLARIKRLIAEEKLSQSDILNMLADSWASESQSQDLIAELTKRLDAQQYAIQVFGDQLNSGNRVSTGARLRVSMILGDTTTVALLKGLKQHLQLRAKSTGLAGARKRHEGMVQLKEWAIAQYRLGSWRSANQAAHSLAGRVIEHGRSIGVSLSEQNAQRTIAEWIRKSV